MGGKDQFFDYILSFKFTTLTIRIPDQQESFLCAKNYGVNPQYTATKRHVVK